MLKPPYAPHVSGRLAFFFGPFSGALVTVINLRRMVHPLKAKRVLRWTLLGTAILAVTLFLIPDPFGRLVGLAAEIGFYLFYPPLQEREFNEWLATHREMQPSNGWKALVWVPVGVILFFLVCFLVMLPLSVLFPNVG